MEPNTQTNIEPPKSPSTIGGINPGSGKSFINDFIKKDQKDQKNVLVRCQISYLQINQKWKRG